MKEYPKIETVFNRDTQGTKKLIKGSFRNELVGYLANNYWYFTEKVDGTNIRVHWDGHEVTFGGRTDRAQIPAKLVQKLVSLFGTSEAEEVFEQLFGEKEVTLYGEGYGAGIQKGGGLYSPDNEFVLFDVQVGDAWLERPSIVDIAKAFDISAVPVVLTGTVAEAVSYVESKPKSRLGGCERAMEGVVGKPMVQIYDKHGKRVIVKIKVCDFE